MLQREQRLIAIEGNIGAGKTSLLKSLRMEPDVRVTFEPETIWNESNALTKFYENPRRYMTMLQSIIAVTSAEMHNLRVYEPYHVMERSFYGARMYMHVGTARGWLEEDQNQMLITLRNQLERNMRVPDVIIYLRTTPDICSQRLRFNPRPYEVEDEYLAMLHHEYDDWLANTREVYESDRLTTKVYEINGNHTKRQVEAAFRMLLAHGFNLGEDADSICSESPMGWVKRLM
jgi:deoxyadenosine/deoxycytidine kinase